MNLAIHKERKKLSRYAMFWRVSVNFFPASLVLKQKIGDHAVSFVNFGVWSELKLFQSYTNFQ